MRHHYRSDAERNILHGCAERWRDAGAGLEDPAHLLGRRHRLKWLPWPVPVLLGLAFVFLAMAVVQSCEHNREPVRPAATHQLYWHDSE